MATKRKRTVFEIQYDADKKLWIIVVSGLVVGFGKLKADVIDMTTTVGRELESQSYLAQVIVKGKDGKIQTEYTYGDDPVKTKG